MGTRKYAECNTEIGELFVVAEEGKIVAVYMGQASFVEEENTNRIVKDEAEQLLKNATDQLIEFFAGSRKEFSLPTHQTGTPFQMSVWKELERIPYGETRSYQEIAEAIGNKKAVRAIGQANKANRIPIIVPCHRVIGKNEKLTGYAGTRTDIKERLLLIEGARFKG